MGRLPAKIDKRTLKLRSILLVPELPPLPNEYDVDAGLQTSVPEQMFDNDQWGDCVIAGRANWTLRAEYFEQKTVLPITTSICLKEYWKEGGASCWNKHPDNGLVMLDSLNEWRTRGWMIAKKTYCIDAFASINWKKHEELGYATFLLGGAYLGINVPQSAIDQFHKDEPWTVVEDSPIVGGHCIYIVGYNNVGPICVTWGKKQQMDWDFCDTYCEEAYGIVDKVDKFLPNSPLDVEKLVGYLHSIEVL